MRLSFSTCLSAGIRSISIPRKPLSLARPSVIVTSRECPRHHFSVSPLASSSSSDSVAKLQNAFKDPNSPYYLEPGAQGPADPGVGFINPEKVHVLGSDSPISHIKPEPNPSMSPVLSITDEMRALAHATLSRKGFDPTSYYEEVINWGDMDAFQHVNNVRYVRFLESGRLVWMYHLALEVGGAQLARNMISGRGVSLILKDISIRYRRPVTYPDTLLIAHKPHDLHPMHFSNAGIVWSYAQQTVVATSDSTLVWYDYDKLKKCDPGEEKRAFLEQRIKSLSGEK